MFASAHPVCACVSVAGDGGGRSVYKRLERIKCNTLSMDGLIFYFYKAFLKHLCVQNAY